MPGRPAAAGAREQLQDRAVERQRHPRSVARLAVGPERATMTQRGQPGKGERQDPVARPATCVRDEPDAARVVLEPRVVQRSGGRGAGGVGFESMACLSGRWDGAAAVDCRRRPVRRIAGVDVATTGAGGSPAPWSSHLIGSLAVDGQVEPHRLDFGLDPHAEQEVDDLDDDERADRCEARSSRRRRRPG